MPLSLAIAKSVESYYRPGMMLWHYEHGLVLYAVYMVGISRCVILCVCL